MWTTPDIVRTLLTVGATFISIIALWNSYRFSKESAKRAQVSAAIAGFNAKAAYRKNLMDWAGQVQDAICEAHEALIREIKDEAVNEKVSKSLAKITSLIDRGRWLLPNTNHERYGTNKEAAYTGLRQEALDVLVFGYDALAQYLKTPAEKNKAIEQLWEVRRQFTSTIQEKIEPRIMDNELIALNSQVQK